jgi:hypothetical protein
MTNSHRNLRLSRFILLAAALGIGGSVVPSVCGQCEPSTPVPDQKRTRMKHRKPASNGTLATTVTLTEILDWGTPEDITDKDVKNSNTPIDPLEEEVFEVEGDLWRIAQEANDCDYHLELSGPGKAAKDVRIIVEIPNDPGYATARQNLLDALNPADRAALEAKGEVVLTKGVRLRVRGNAFFDAFHYTAKFDPAKPGRCKFTREKKLKRGNNHGTCMVGTLWELHPTWRVDAVGTH